jgi:hypothetical protein
VTLDHNGTSSVLPEERAPEASPAPGLPEVAERRQTDRRQGDRRSGTDRRSRLERRRGPGRRRSDLRRAAEEGEITDDLFEFVMAMDEYKRVNKKPFPSWSEVYQVVLYLGYRKVAEKGTHIDKPAPDPAPIR